MEYQRVRRVERYRGRKHLYFRAWSGVVGDPRGLRMRWVREASPPFVHHSRPSESMKGQHDQWGAAVGKGAMSSRQNARSISHAKTLQAKTLAGVYFRLLLTKLLSHLHEQVLDCSRSSGFFGPIKSEFREGIPCDLGVSAGLGLNARTRFVRSSVYASRLQLLPHQSLTARRYVLENTSQGILSRGGE